MNTTHKARIGSISHGTLLASDLIISFADELRLYAPDHDRVKEADAVQTLWASGWTDIYDQSEQINELVNDLQDALNEYAPPYCYFGNTEGDGSDFGFWPCMEQIGELPRVSDPNEVEQHAGEDCAFVNDHGNVTVYGSDGAVLIDFV
jgi:hypothetical protein